MSFPNTHRSAESPLPPAELRGVRIAAAPASAAKGPLRLSGSFQLPASAARAIDANPHRALVVVVWSLPFHDVQRPFHEQALFPDDAELRDGLCRGFFNLGLYEDQQSLPRGDYYVSVSLGDFLSNTVHIAVG